MKKRLSLWVLLCQAALGISACLSIPASAVDWTITDLGTLGGTWSEATGINDRGWVVGASTTNGDTASHAFLYDGTTMRDLLTLGGDWSEAYGINNNGQVAGVSAISGDATYHAFLYDGTTMRDLGTLGGSWSTALSINNNGQVAGESITSDANYIHAFLHDGTTMRDLLSLGGNISSAYGINNQGQVVGESYLSDGTTIRAFLHDGTIMRDLGSFGGTTSSASSINDRGQIVGYSYTSGDADAHAFLYDGAMRDLSTLPEVVAAGWLDLTSGTPAINDSGQITGLGLIGNGEAHAYLLHPQTTSRYMQTVDPVTLYNLGCTQTNQNGVLILDFGQPWINGTDYGTIFPGTSGGFVSISSIESAVRFFLNGYYTCGGRGHMTVAVGTNNYGSNTNFAHGQAWGQMLTRLNAYITGPANLSDRLAVVGASDIEIGYNTPVNSRAWVDGYASASPVGYYNYGDAQGCPTTGTGPCDHGWTQEDVWYVSWGSPANPLPVPEIYYNAPPGPPTHAQRWAALATLHGVNPMFIPGVLTQWQACQDPGRSCTAGYDAPVQAWRQLMDALYNVSPDPTTVQKVLYSSDITWQN